MGTFGGVKRIKDNSCRRGIPAQKKAQRRMDAQVRQAVYDSLTLEQKLNRAGAKEKAKLLKRAATKG